MIYTIVCKNGHERKDSQPDGICVLCGMSMSKKPEKKDRPKKTEEVNTNG